MGFFSRTETVVAREAGLTLVLGEKHVSAGWWAVDDGQIVVQQTSGLHHFVDHQEGLVEADASLQELDRASEEVTKVVFGVEPGWMASKGELSDEAKAWLKKLSESLTLKPLGFAVSPEAYVQQMLHRQPQANAIVVYLTTQEVFLTVLRLGQIQVQESVGRSGNLAADVVEALARHETAESIWPAKVWLVSASLSSDELQALRHDFVTFTWGESTPWSAAPLLEVVPTAELVAAVSEEAGRAATGLVATVAPQLEQKDQTTAKTFGIPVEMHSTSQPTTPELEADLELEVPRQLGKKTGPSLIQRWLRQDRAFVSHHPFILAGIVLGVLTVTVMGWLYLRLATRAVVTIVPQTSTITDTISVLFGASSAGGSDQLSLPAKTISTEVSVTKNTPSTGVKLVGDKAKGQVVLLNKTTSSKTFVAGTTLSNGAVQFVTDSEVTVASASVQTAGDSETKTFGKGTVAVTAAKIGPDSNLAANTTFTVDSFDQSTYAASNEVAFTGGSSREARAVAEVDRQKLLQDARQEAMSQAEPLFKQQINAGEYALPTGQMKTIDATYTAEVGDETEAVGLTLQAQVNGVVYQATDLHQAVESALMQKVPTGNELVRDKIEMLSAPDTAASASSAVKLLVTASAPVRPIVDANQVAQQIAGKPAAQLSSLVSSIVPISTVRITFTPSIAAKILQILPAVARLQVTVE